MAILQKSILLSSILEEMILFTVRQLKNFSSSKVLKMEAYDAAVLSYAMATAATKIKPPLLGIGPIMPPAGRLAEADSLTPPTRHDQEKDEQNYLCQLLGNVEQKLGNKMTVQLPQLMEICSMKQSQVGIFYKKTVFLQIFFS